MRGYKVISFNMYSCMCKYRSEEIRPKFFLCNDKPQHRMFCTTDCCRWRKLGRNAKLNTGRSGSMSTSQNDRVKCILVLSKKNPGAVVLSELDIVSLKWVAVLLTQGQRKGDDE
jgi:hypothetical protein